MSETKIDFVPQPYPLYVPVMPYIPWLPPNEGEGLWRAELSELTDEALADEISKAAERLSRYWVACEPPGGGPGHASGPARLSRPRPG
jgi:hypothetical protein